MKPSGTQTEPGKPRQRQHNNAISNKIDNPHLLRYTSLLEKLRNKEVENIKIKNDRVLIVYDLEKYEVLLADGGLEVITKVYGVREIQQRFI